MKHVFFIFLFFLLCVSCSPKVITGLYSTALPGQISFVNQQLKLNEDGTFIYNYASDDLNSNQKGKGKYQLLDRKLILTFESFDAGISLMTKNKASSKFNNVLRLLVQDLDDRPLVGVSLTLRDLENKLIIRGITNEKGNCVLPWKEGQSPGSIEASYIGFSNFIGAVNQDTSLDYTISMSHTYRAIEAGTVWEYLAKKTGQDRMVLVRDNRKSTFVKIQE